MVESLSDGWCLDQNGDDQNNGITTIPGNFTSSDCFVVCRAEDNGRITGCEWDNNGTCAYHTKPLSGGSGNKDHTCLVLKGKHLKTTHSY